MRRKYWVERPLYELYYTESKEDEEYLPDCAERITRKEAIKLARLGAKANKEEGRLTFAEEIEPLRDSSDRSWMMRMYYLSKDRIWEKEWFYNLFF